ncbi:hypothetical protein AB6A40_005192 [Gnathostoma spinigerum]|uniref:Mic1 domain-containing protein n=1 Tax=Gnathostoma spinigerum TaxID=75299 RepID=A0ABD6EEW1_9BILA
MLCLGDQWIAFEASSTLSDIFYDDVNQKICTVRGNGALGVTAKGLQTRDFISFRMKDCGKIKIMKFSPDGRIASVQREEFTVDFVCISPNEDGSACIQFSQSAKLRYAPILGLEWIAANQLLFVTKQGLELYQVSVEKKTCKLLKTQNISLNWFIYYPNSGLLIASSGKSGSLLSPFILQNGVIHCLAKFQVDFGRSISKTNLAEREVSVASVYGQLYVLVLRYSTRESKAEDIAMYQLSSNPMQEATLVHKLVLDLPGAFATHVLDNIIIVHHQPSHRSLIYDVRIHEPRAYTVPQHRPIAVVEITHSPRLNSDYPGEIPLYSPSWVMFPPNLIVDASIGLFSTLSLVPESACSILKKKVDLLRFLMNRTTTKEVFLAELRDCLMNYVLTLKDAALIFDWIISAYRRSTENILYLSESSSRFRLVCDEYQEMVINQHDIVRRVFLPVFEGITVNRQRFVQYMLIYLRVVLEHSIEIDPYFVNEILVPTMVEAGDLDRLQQLLQYRVIPDAKQLAFQLLSHEAKHAPLIQFAVDMLARLGSAAEEIVEVLLSKGSVVEAIRFLESVSRVDKVSGLRLMECAMKENRQVQYAVYRYFQEKTNRSKYSSSQCKFVL